MQIWTYMLIITALISREAYSATIIHTDRNGFSSTVGNYIIDGYDSETYGWDAEDPYGSVRLTDEELNALSPEVIYSTGFDINWVGFVYTDQADPGVYCSGCNLAVTMNFTDTSIGTSSGIYAVGLDIAFDRASDEYPTLVRHTFVTFADGSMIEYALPRVTATDPVSFWGVMSDKLISSITFDDPEDYIAKTSFAIDNLTVATNPVPIPPAVWLFGSGLLGLIGIARRRANA